MKSCDNQAYVLSTIAEEGRQICLKQKNVVQKDIMHIHITCMHVHKWSRRNAKLMGFATKGKLHNSSKREHVCDNVCYINLFRFIILFRTVVRMFVSVNSGNGRMCMYVNVIGKLTLRQIWCLWHFYFMHHSCMRI